jgi:hypothetical protein
MTTSYPPVAVISKNINYIKSTEFYAPLTQFGGDSFGKFMKKLRKNSALIDVSDSID